MWCWQTAVFSGWFDLALLAQRGVDVVVRKHQLRASDFRTGKRLGKDDHLVRLAKPQRPEWLSAERYEALPTNWSLREVRVHVKQRGFRSQRLVVVTTLVKPEDFPAHEIAELYRRRWQAELHCDSLKVVLQMDHLRCKRRTACGTSFTCTCLAYNLVRRVMALAAAEAKVPPWQISFKAALQRSTTSFPGSLRACRWTLAAKPLSSASPRTGLAIVPIASSLAASNDDPNHTTCSSGHATSTNDWPRRELQKFKCHSSLR